MSYILGALRKAEHERKGEDDQKVDDWDSKEWNSVETSSGISLGLKIAAVLVIALLAAIFILLWILIGNLSEPASNSDDAGIFQGIEQAEPVELIAAPDSAATELPNLDGNTAQSPEPAQPADSVVSAAVDARIENDLAVEPQIPVITGHLHFPANDSLSRIFADSGSYRVGHVFADGLKLVSISESQAVFEWRDKRYEVALGSY